MQHWPELIVTLRIPVVTTSKPPLQLPHAVLKSCSPAHSPNVSATPASATLALAAWHSACPKQAIDRHHMQRAISNCPNLIVTHDAAPAASSPGIGFNSEKEFMFQHGASCSGYLLLL